MRLREHSQRQVTALVGRTLNLGALWIIMTAKPSKFVISGPTLCSTVTQGYSLRVTVERCTSRAYRCGEMVVFQRTKPRER